MARKGSVAPKERVNIVYRPAVNSSETKELPLKILVVADVTGKPNEQPVDKRESVQVDKDTFADVMGGFDLGLDIAVPDRLSNDEGQELRASLKFKSPKDFSPDSIVKQVPELNKLLELRKALMALKSPVGNSKEFRDRVRSLLADKDSREKLMRELGIDPSETH